MEGCKSKLLCGAVGVSSGLPGVVSLSNCTGGACTSCFLCAGAVAGILLLALVQKIKGMSLQTEGRG